MVGVASKDHRQAGEGTLHITDHAQHLLLIGATEGDRIGADILGSAGHFNRRFPTKPLEVHRVDLSNQFDVACTDGIAILHQFMGVGLHHPTGGQGGPHQRTTT